MISSNKTVNSLGFSGSWHPKLVGGKNYLGVGTHSFIKGLTSIEHKSSDILPPEIKNSDFTSKDDYYPAVFFFYFGKKLGPETASWT